jgi:hypothetical protein
MLSTAQSFILHDQIVDNQLETMWKEVSCLILRYSERLRKDMISFKQDGQCLVHDFNQAPPEYKSEAT